MRFLQQNSSHGPLLAERPKTPDKICEMDSLDLSWENNLTEVRFFSLSLGMIYILLVVCKHYNIFFCTCADRGNASIICTLSY